jgi:hypothetical protein
VAFARLAYLAREFPLLIAAVGEKFAHLAQILKYSNTLQTPENCRLKFTVEDAKDAKHRTNRSQSASATVCHFDPFDEAQDKLREKSFSTGSTARTHAILTQSLRKRFEDGGLKIAILYPTFSIFDLLYHARVS